MVKPDEIHAFTSFSTAPTIRSDLHHES